MGRMKGRESNFWFNREILLFFHWHVKKQINSWSKTGFPIEFWIFKNNLSNPVTCTGCKSGSAELGQSQCFLALGGHGGPLSPEVWAVPLRF